MALSGLLVTLWLLLNLSSTTLAYIPAVPTNDTSSLISNSEDFVQITWQANGAQQGIIKDVVSRQLVSDQTNASLVGVNYGERGALVHFTETNSTTWPPSEVPWIAFINCDTNGTTYTLQNDIFTMARDGGAAAALLYSFTGQACLINQDYLLNFQKPLDVYTTLGLQTARLIENQFSSVSAFSYWFDSALLNNSANAIWQSLNDTEVVVTPSSVLAALSSWENAVYSASQFNSTSYDAGRNGAGNINGPKFSMSDFNSSQWQGWSDSADGNTTDADSGATAVSSSNLLDPTNAVVSTQLPLARRQAISPTATTGTVPVPTPTAVTYLIAIVGNADADYVAANATQSGTVTTTTFGNTNTSLAMIILYAITGCVTALFLFVILCGAIRAVRNPERYGPRAHGVGGRPGQSRAGGISRAILDSIPLVRYSRANEDAQTAVPVKDDDAEELEMGQRRTSIDSTQVVDMDADGPAVVGTLSQQPRSPRRRDSTMSGSSKGLLAGEDEKHDMEDALVATPAAPAAAEVSHVCPICLVAFEEGEDMRILPCDGRHRFHQDCIDPWLLNVSSLCPLCRWDVSMKREDSTLAEVDETAEGVANAEQYPTQSRLRRAFSTHPRDSLGGVGFTPTRFSRYLAQVRAAASSAGTVGRRRSARLAAVAVIEPTSPVIAEGREEANIEDGREEAREISAQDAGA